jgi:hypothetical protein
LVDNDKQEYSVEHGKNGDAEDNDITLPAAANTAKVCSNGQLDEYLIDDEKDGASDNELHLISMPSKHQGTNKTKHTFKMPGKRCAAVSLSTHWAIVIANVHIAINMAL